MYINKWILLIESRIGRRRRKKWIRADKPTVTTTTTRNKNNNQPKRHTNWPMDDARDAGGIRSADGEYENGESIIIIKIESNLGALTQHTTCHIYFICIYFIIIIFGLDVSCLALALGIGVVRRVPSHIVVHVLYTLYITFYYTRSACHFHTPARRSFISLGLGIYTHTTHSTTLKTRVFIFVAFSLFNMLFLDFIFASK